MPEQADTDHRDLAEERGSACSIYVRCAALGLSWIAASALAGCVVPFAVPPMQGAVGATVWSPSRQTATVEALHLAARARPLGVVRKFRERPLDPGIGVISRIAPGDKRAKGYEVGPAFGFDAYPATYFEGDLGVRFVLGAELRPMYRSVVGFDKGWGLGSAVRTGVEAGWFWEGGCAIASDKDSGAIACGMGEGGLGLVVEGSLDSFKPDVAYALVLALEFRLPLMAGVAVTER